MSRERGRTGIRSMVLGLVAIGAICATVSTALAVPPPPPNPSDTEINSSRAQANARAGEVGQLTNQLAEAESRLADLQATVQLKMEEANKALVDLQTAQDAAGQARQDANNARKEADAAAGEVEFARTNLDKFISGSFQQGSTIGSVTAYLASDSRQDLLARAQLLQAVGGSQFNALEVMQRAQTAKGNKEASARKALDVAEQKEREAEQAKGAADAAQNAAIQAQEGQNARNQQLEADKSAVEQRLFEAQSKVSGLQGQRQRYQDWLAQKQREEEEAARRAAEAASGNDRPQPQGSRPPRSRPPSGPVGSSIEAVIARAMAQRGITYAWGGGNGRGPTRGIRDGGVADRFGDYRKVGFDCSGLMIYAFAGVKSLAHYSGYQYHSGRKVPLSQMRRGDMLFWGGGRGIHHVALYLGNGQMIEAPHSGSVVKISPVRYGGIMPYATRLIE